MNDYIWRKDSQGGYTLLNTLINDCVTAECETLTKRTPKYIPITEQRIYLADFTSINQRTWNGETWNDNGKQYAPIYEQIDEDNYRLIGVTII